MKKSFRLALIKFKPIFLLFFFYFKFKSIYFIFFPVLFSLLHLFLSASLKSLIRLSLNAFEFLKESEENLLK